MVTLDVREKVRFKPRDVTLFLGLFLSFFMCSVLIQSGIYMSKIAALFSPEDTTVNKTHRLI